MSRLARQSLKFSLISYFSFAVGTLANLVLYPLNWEFAGKLQAITAYAESIYPFVLLGLSASLVKFYPLLKEKQQEKKYFNFSLIMILISTVVFVGIYLTFKEQFAQSKFYESAYFVFVIVLFYALNELFTKQAANLERIAIPTIFNNLFPRLGIITAFVLYFFFQFSFFICFLVLASAYALSFIGNFFYINKLDQLNTDFSFDFLVDKKFSRELMQYSFYALLVNVGYSWSFRIDKLLINELIDSKSVAIYSTFLAMLTAINIPTNGVYAISSPIISKHLNDNNIKDLKTLYQQNSLRLFLLGSLLFCMILAASDSLFLLMKNSEQLIVLKPILYLLGFSTLLDIATGFNSVVISFSKYYKFNLWALGVLVFLTFLCNYIFLVPMKMGIIGVALATFVSMAIFNIVKSIFIYLKFGIQPFTKAYFSIALMISFSILSLAFLPSFTQNWFNFIYKPILMPFIFVFINCIFPVFSWKEIQEKTGLSRFLNR